MRIWDIPVSKLCRQHLLGEHRELHAIWSIIVNNKKGYSNHPEVNRWRGNLGGLWSRHQGQVSEMERRGYHHKSPIELTIKIKVKDFGSRPKLITPIKEQIKLLKSKGCDCDV